MKYNIMYDTNAADAAQTYLDKHNPLARVVVIDHIKRYADTVAQQYINYTPGGMSIYCKCGGLTLIASIDGTTSKGYPIVCIDISVDATFLPHQYEICKMRDGTMKNNAAAL